MLSEQNVLTVYPQGEEKKYIKSRYGKAGLAVLTDLLIFQIVSRLFLLIVGLFVGGEGGILNVISAGREAVMSNAYTTVLFSAGFPILAEMSAIFLGVKWLGIDLKSKFNRQGYNVLEIAGGTALGFFLQTAAVFIIMIIFVIFKGGTAEVTQNVIVQNNNFGADLILYTYVCLLGPVIEEVLFRGIVLESARKYNERFAIIFSALIFGIMHGNITQAVNGFLIGLVLGALYVRSDSLVPSAVMHILMNTVTSIMQVMMYSSPTLVDDLLEGSFTALAGLPFAGIALNLAVRVITFPAGIAVLAVTGSKGFGLRKANAAGKKRSAPLLFSTPAWIAVIVGYCIVIAVNF